MTATVTRLPSPFTVQLVQHGVAEQLARVAYFRTMEHPQADELDCVARFLLGAVGGREATDLLWSQLRDDCQRLWHLITDDWDDRDLDELTDGEWARSSFPSAGYEIDARYEKTRDRLTGEIESAIYRARVAAVEARRAVAL